MSGANCESFKTALNTDETLTLHNKNTNEIDTALETWYSKITIAMKNNIPKTTYRTLPHAQLTHEEKIIQTRFTNLHEFIKTYGWSPHITALYRNLKEELLERCKVKHDEKWNQLIANIQADYRNPKAFWTKIKNLMGTNSEESSYLIDNNGKKITEPKLKEPIFRTFWSSIYQITDQDNRNFCRETEHVVETHLNQNTDKWQQSRTINLNTKNRGTNTAIALIYEAIANAATNRNQCNIVLRDVSKAFDKVWHEGLKYKIIQLNMPPNITALLCNFLDNRQGKLIIDNYTDPLEQIVCDFLNDCTAQLQIGSYIRPPIELESGVPQ
ncbi:uncharacterized protein LOC121855190, partial [Homarus americanus]|uniref:uncharacterized protein LOC121855190 n=1 Tax=Homarus americanus TaxID=6706 RepID=UPI001C440C7A